MSTLIKVIRGDDETIQLTFKDSDGVAINITGYTIFFTVKLECEIDVSDSVDATAVIKKEITSHSDPTHGITQLVLNEADTNLAPGIYYWDLQLVKDGVVSSTQRGELELTTDITRRTT